MPPTTDNTRQNTEEHTKILVLLTKLIERNHELLIEVRELTERVERTERDRLEITHRFQVHMDDSYKSIRELSQKIDTGGKLAVAVVILIAGVSETIPVLQSFF